MANDPYWNNVVLAMHMDDTGLTDLKGHVVTLNGNVARSATQSKFGGYSAYFDGSGDYITVQDSADWCFYDDDWSIEAWIYPTTSDAIRSIVVQRIATDVTQHWVFRLLANNTLAFTATAANTPVTSVTSSTTVQANMWTHVAAVRSAGHVSLLVNGVNSTTVVIDTTATYSDMACPLVIGRGYSDVDVYNFTGYIDDLRITKGVARYTANFAVPTEAFPNTPPQLIGTVTDANSNLVSRPVIAIPRNRASVSYATISDATTGAFTLPAYDGSAHTVIALPVEGDPYWDNVVLAMHMDGTNGSTTFTDEKGHTVTAYGGAQISTAQSKFGGASAYFDGVDASNTRLEIADSDDWHFDGAYTVEMFVNMSVQKTTAIHLIQQGQVAGGVFCPLRIDITANGKVVILGSSDNSAWNSVTYNSGFVFTSSTALGTNQWYHIALSDDGKTCRLFINGVCESSRPTWTKTNFAYPLLIGGAYSSGDREFNGYIDDIRITKGVARYIHDFTPPSSAFPHDITGGTENAIILDNITPV